MNALITLAHGLKDLRSGDYFDILRFFFLLALNLNACQESEIYGLIKRKQCTSILRVLIVLDWIGPLGLLYDSWVVFFHVFSEERDRGRYFTFRYWVEGFTLSLLFGPGN
jgi:hypothetical protein